MEIREWKTLSSLWRKESIDSPAESNFHSDAKFVIHPRNWMGIYDWGMNRAKGTVELEKNTDPNNTHTNRNRGS